LRPIPVKLRYEVLKGDRFYPVNYASPLGFLRFRAVPAAQRIRAGLLFFLLLKLRRRPRPDLLSADRLAVLDDESMADYLTRRLGEAALEYFFEPVFGAYCGWRPEEISKAVFAFSVFSGLQRYFFLRQGTGQLTEALASRVPVRLGVEVVSVEARQDGVICRTRDPLGRAAETTADAAILAVPGPVARGLWPNAPRAHQSFLENSRYAPQVVVHFCTNRDWNHENRYGLFFPRKTGRATSGVAFEHLRAPGRAPAGKALLYTGPATARHRESLRENDRTIVELCSRDLEPYFPALRESITDAHVFRWENAVPLFPVASIRHLAAYARHRDRSRIVLAGD